MKSAEILSGFFKKRFRRINCPSACLHTQSETDRQAGRHLQVTYYSGFANLVIQNLPNCGKLHHLGMYKMRDGYISLSLLFPFSLVLCCSSSETTGPWQWNDIKRLNLGDSKFCNKNNNSLIFQNAYLLKSNKF